MFTKCPKLNELFFPVNNIGFSPPDQSRKAIDRKKLFFSDMLQFSLVVVYNVLLHKYYSEHTIVFRRNSALLRHALARCLPRFFGIRK